MTQVDVVVQNMKLLNKQELTIYDDAVWIRAWNDLIRQKKCPTCDFKRWKSNTLGRARNNARFYEVEDHGRLAWNSKPLIVLRLMEG